MKKVAISAIVVLLALILFSVLTYERPVTLVVEAPPTTAVTATTSDGLDDLFEWFVDYGPVTLAYLDVVGNGANFISEFPESTQPLACADVWDDLEALFDELLEAADDAPISIEGDFRLMTGHFGEALYHCMDGDIASASVNFATSSRAMDDFNESIDTVLNQP